MRSQDLYNIFATTIDKEFNGNITPPKFLTLYNSMQIEYMDFCLGSMMDYRAGQSVSRNSPEASTSAMSAVAPFWKPRFAATVTNGRCHINQGDFYGAWRLFVPGWMNPACGSEDMPERWEIPLEEIPAQEWAVRTNPKRYNCPDIEHPAFMQLEDGDALVLPLDISSIWVSYIRRPRPVTIALLPDGDVDPLAVNDDPEWNDIDAKAILKWCMEPAGIREQVPSWVQYGRQGRTGQ